MRDRLTDIYDRLLERYGPRDWWPADSRFEVMVGAVLVQNTAWSNAEKAIQALFDADCCRLMDSEARTWPTSHNSFTHPATTT